MELHANVSHEPVDVLLTNVVLREAVIRDERFGFSGCDLFWKMYQHKGLGPMNIMKKMIKLTIIPK